MQSSGCRSLTTLGDGAGQLGLVHVLPDSETSDTTSTMSRFRRGIVICTQDPQAAVSRGELPPVGTRELPQEALSHQFSQRFSTLLVLLYWPDGLILESQALRYKH